MPGRAPVARNLTRGRLRQPRPLDLAWPGQPTPYGIYLVQKIVVLGGNSATFSQPTGLGNTVIVAYAGSAGQGSTGTCSVTGITLGSSALSKQIEQDDVASASASCSAVWMLANIPAGQTAITVTGTGLVAADGYTVAYEVAGLGNKPVLDKSSSGPLSAGTVTWTSNATAATTAAAEFIVGVTAHGPNGANDALSGGAMPWTNETSWAWGAGGSALAGYQISNQAGAFTYSGASTDFDFYTCVIAAIKPGFLVPPPVQAGGRPRQAAILRQLPGRVTQKPPAVVTVTAPQPLQNTARSLRPGADMRRARPVQRVMQVPPLQSTARRLRPAADMRRPRVTQIPPAVVVVKAPQPLQNTTRQVRPGADIRRARAAQRVIQAPVPAAARTRARPLAGTAGQRPRPVPVAGGLPVARPQVIMNALSRMRPGWTVARRASRMVLRGPVPAQSGSRTRGAATRPVRPAGKVPAPPVIVAQVTPVQAGSRARVAALRPVRQAQRLAAPALVQARGRQRPAASAPGQRQRAMPVAVAPVIIPPVVSSTLSRLRSGWVAARRRAQSGFRMPVPSGQTARPRPAGLRPARLLQRSTVAAAPPAIRRTVTQPASTRPVRRLLIAPPGPEVAPKQVITNAIARARAQLAIVRRVPQRVIPIPVPPPERQAARQGWPGWRRRYQLPQVPAPLTATSALPRAVRSAVKLTGIRPSARMQKAGAQPAPPQSAMRRRPMAGTRPAARGQLVPAPPPVAVLPPWARPARALWWGIRRAQVPPAPYQPPPPPFAPLPPWARAARVFGWAPRRAQVQQKAPPALEVLPPLPVQAGSRARWAWVRTRGRTQKVPAAGIIPAVPTSRTRSLAGWRTRERTQQVRPVFAPVPPSARRVIRVAGLRARGQIQRVPSAILVPGRLARARLAGLRTWAARGRVVPAQVPPLSWARSRRLGGTTPRGPATARSLPAPLRLTPHARRERRELAGLARRLGVSYPLAQPTLAPPVRPYSPLTRRLPGWVRRIPGLQLPLPAGQVVQGSATLAAFSVMAAAATAGPDLDALWAAYQAAKTAADRATENWEEHMRTLGGHSWASGGQFGIAYELQYAAGQAYEAWQAAWQQVNQAPPSQR
jgi:hypothetical protein